MDNDIADSRGAVEVWAAAAALTAQGRVGAARDCLLCVCAAGVAVRAGACASEFGEQARAACGARNGGARAPRVAGGRVCRRRALIQGAGAEIGAALGEVAVAEEAVGAATAAVGAGERAIARKEATRADVVAESRSALMAERMVASSASLGSCGAQCVACSCSQATARWTPRIVTLTIRRKVCLRLFDCSFACVLCLLVRVWAWAAAGGDSCVRYRRLSVRCKPRSAVDRALGCQCIIATA